MYQVLARSPRGKRANLGICSSVVIESKPLLAPQCFGSIGKGNCSVIDGSLELKIACHIILDPGAYEEA